MTATVRVDDGDGIRTVVLDRPDARNALDSAMRARLCEVLTDADRDPAVRVVILTAVDPAFCAGVDFKDVTADADRPDARSRVNPGQVLRAMTTPVICAVNGACVSGGLEVALSTSFVVASDRARFADTHARLGVVATWGLTALLPRAVGVRKARELSITGNFVDAAEALRIGLANHVVPHEQLTDFARSLAADVADHPAAAEVLALYDRGEDLSLAAALALETAHAATRSYDAAAFRAAGEVTARRGSTR